MSQSMLPGSAELTSIVAYLLSPLVNVKDIVDKLHRQAFADTASIS